MKLAIFPCLGLGDGLIVCTLAHNLSQSGYQVDLFHPLLPQLQPLFPHVSFFLRPSSLEGFEEKYDKLLFFYEKLPWMQKAMEFCPEKTRILNPIATPNRDYPFWEEGQFDGNLPFVENLKLYAEKKWGVPDATRDTGIQMPDHVMKGKFPKRILIHPTSSRAGKNWSKEKFLQLANLLKRDGLDPEFILTEKEKQDWPEIEARKFSNLYELATFIAEGGFCFGNCSGIGHLASCLSLSTLTISRSRLSANFWRPAWSKGEVIVPPRWVPNLKGLRLRDQNWQKFISVKEVYQTFLKLYEPSILCY